MSKSKTNKIEYVLGVVDRFGRPMKRFNDAVDDAVRPVRRVKHALADVGREAGFDKIGRQVGRVRTKLAGLVSTAAMVTGALAGAAGGIGFALVSTSEELSRLRSQADSVGMDPRNLMAYGSAVKELGFDFENVVDLVEEMNNKFGESKGLEQTTPVKEALQILKLDFAEIARMKPEEQLKRIMAAAGAMKDQQKAVSAVDILMGGEANKMMGHLRALAAEQGKSIEEVLEDYQRMNLLTSEGLERFKLFSRAGNGLFSVMKSGFQELLSLLAARLVPLLRSSTEWIIDNFDNIKARVGSMLENFDHEAFLAKAREVWDVLTTIGSVIGTVVDLLGGVRGVAVLLGGVIAGKLVLALGSAAMAFQALGIAIMTTPVGLIMGAIALIAGAAVLLVRNWESVADYFRRFVGGLKLLGSDIVESFASILADVVDTVSDFGRRFLGGLKLLGSDIVESFASAWDAIADTVSGVADAVIAPFAIAFDWIAGKLGWLGDAAAAVAGALGFGGDSPGLSQPAAVRSGSQAGEYSAAARRAGQLNETRYSSETVSRQESRLAVDFTNVPSGTRIRREGSAPLDMSMGYAMVGEG